MRTFLDEGAITFEGDFYNYNGLFTFARPVQEHLPLLIGVDAWPEVLRGRRRVLRRLPPRAQLLPRGVRVRRRALQDRRRARRARPDELDFGAWVVTVVGRDSAAAKQAAAIDRRVLHLLDAARAARAPRDRPCRAGARSSKRSARATSPRRIELTSPEARRQALDRRHARRGRREDQADIEPTGVNHMILASPTPHSSRPSPAGTVDVPDVRAQLRLVHDEVMPHFA